MEAARCQICGKPMSSWLEVCGDLCVCMNCAATVTLSDLSGAGFAKVKPDTYQMDGETLVTKDSPDEILNYQDAKQKLSTMYGMKVETVIPYSDTDSANPMLQNMVKAMTGEIHEEMPTARGDIMDTLHESYSWEMPEIVDAIHKIGFATEAAFFAHCNALRDSGYTAETSFVLILCDRYCERAVIDDDGTTHDFLAEQASESLVTKETPDVLPVYNDDGTEVA